MLPSNTLSRTRPQVGIRRLTLGLLLLGAAGAVTGCEDELKANADDRAPDTEKVKTVQNGETFEAAVDATDQTVWVGYDFETAGEAVAGSATLLLQWTGARLGVGVEAVAVDTAFEALTEAPKEGWAFEPEGTDTQDAHARPAGPLGGWFDYNPTTHFVSPADVRYAVRTAEGGCFKLQFTSWYDDAGTTGMFGFDWAPLAGCR